MSRCLAIPPEGECTESDEEPDVLARKLLGTDSLDVISARGIPGPVHVMHIDDWGKVNGLALNRRAWALYGGSPVYGLVVLSVDDRSPLGRNIVSTITGPRFPDAAINAAMDQWLAEHPDL